MAVTDYLGKKIYYSKRFTDSNSHKTLRHIDIRVLIHEICHCVLYSYGLLYDIHKAVKKDYWILAEEWICNFLYDYGLEAQQIGIDMLDENSQT
uniref:Metallopeptidase domain protein n=1 Tax=Siphoviridae sp. ctgBD49 TaxID=2826420 RepID=A0A8S5QQ41_9CAUD|nr:MAG TPA: Putative metallopeptidase domain protein [Siphoviridae sp. ctgBD49]